VYSTLYNLDYLAPGRQVVQLFKHAEWKTFINDVLVFRVLSMAVFAVASLTGLTVVAVASMLWSTRGDFFDANDLALICLARLVFGATPSRSLLFLLVSASRAVMVCLAESPYEFAPTCSRFDRRVVRCLLVGVAGTKGGSAAVRYQHFSYSH
jgi:hypothetical protein